MNTIGTTGHERQLDTRQAAPATAPFDRSNDRPGKGNKDRDSDRTDHRPGSGTASARSTAGAQRKLNMTV